MRFYSVARRALANPPGRALRRLAKDDSGAALAVTLGVFLFMWVLCCGVYSVGENVRRKIELQNAADAAAYSAALVQADTISRIAAINQAMAFTYINMVREQLQYIPANWIVRGVLEKTDESMDHIKDHVRFHCPDPMCTRHRGWDRSESDTDCPVMNYYMPYAATMTSARTSRTSLEDWRDNVLRTRPQNDVFGAEKRKKIRECKAAIRSMNDEIKDIVDGYEERVENVVKAVLAANLPDDIKNSGLLGYSLVNPLPEYDDGRVGWMRVLTNTMEDERRFLQFANQYWTDENENFIIFTEQYRYNPDMGVNTWFVRSSEANKPNDSPYNEWWDYTESQTKKGDPDIEKGIQRRYNLRSRNERRDNTPLPLTFPPANYDRDSGLMKGTRIGPFAGLVAEWRHMAYMRNFATGCHYEVYPPRHVPGIYLPAFTCPLKGCTLGPGGAWPELWFYDRVYADDTNLLDDCYVGELCWPRVLRDGFLDSPGYKDRGFFGPDGAILVAVERKAENVWQKIVDGASSGIYSIFNPTVPHQWAVAAARAGYKEWDAYGNGYQLGDTKDDNGGTYDDCWNLRQTDWNAFLLPVKDAFRYLFANSYGAAPQFADVEGAPSSYTPLSYLYDGSALGATWSRITPPPGFSGENLTWKDVPLGGEYNVYESEYFSSSGGAIDWVKLNERLVH